MVYVMVETDCLFVCWLFHYLKHRYMCWCIVECKYMVLTYFLKL